ncbi:AraC family transcriptional regulator [Orenia metallireducens]|jgi:AraC family transcriptional regulator|uniref:Transcriptional regulator, AraC family n=1 Tax=Orenia metallireducens TaxID=1413210 RepID=A0A285HW31_9FIRM|nr:AraC family transcriptional regulator [Orenia metallireducens]PRX29327.1 AraC family transcriptional regulator [Orenia metallireducens]SNY39899.1 transcriptional regulator, AraC family [Orenia metallireducens]
MDWLEQINRVMEYIEENLADEISYDKVAKMACCSKYHFSRMFSSIMGITLSQYIRRRRLSLAAFELQNSDIKIIDLAMKYGYSSADSFSRAFYNLHGVNPSIARNNGVQLKAFPKMSFQITIKGDVEMEYRIERLDFEFTVVGVKNTILTEKSFEMVPKIWEEASKTGLVQRLIDMSWEDPQCKLESLLGVVGEQPSITDEKFEYMIGVRYKNKVPEDMEKIVIPKSTWAVFPDVTDAWKRLYTEWLPTSGYELADLPCIECYYAPDHEPKDELWVPIIA